ncbi:MAG: NAD-dependent epimerase/dehydratase family protein [Gemmatimonadaceae bacterium]
MRILVTGATGVIGRRAVPLLAAAGHQVTAAGRNPARRAALERAGATTVALDLFDRDAVRRAVDGHEAVINLATHIPPSSTRMLLPGAWRENDRVRREGSANLVDAALAAGVRRFVQESFAPVYPDCGERWIDERTPLQPTRYNRTVVDAERSAERFTERGGIGVVARFASFYGPDSSYLRDMLQLVRRGLAPLPGAGAAFFSSISHDDAALAVVALLGARAGAYNVTDDEPLRRRELFLALSTAFGLPTPKPLPAWMARLMGSIGELLSRSQRMTNGKLRAECGWAPRYVSAREGFRVVAETLREAASREVA